jgi:hypothetical protein
MLVQYKQSCGDTMITANNCPSTHGGSGYPPTTRVAPDGKLYCPFCGVEMNPFIYNTGHATYISGAPKQKLPLLQRLFPRLFHK